MAKDIKRGLGRGLSALISTEENITTSGSGDGILEIEINKIKPNKNQPRKRFEEASLVELAQSISEFGIIQPLIVTEEYGYYSIVAGERRWRAAKIAKLQTVPAIVKKFDELEKLQISLIENIQRQELNPIEEALCYQKLSEIFFFRQEDIAVKAGKSRATISAIMSLLKLDPRVQNLIIEGKLNMGHGRKLLEIENKNLQFEISEKIIEEDMNITQAAQYIELIKNPKGSSKKENSAQVLGIEYKQVERDLQTVLGTKVNIRNKNNKGRIEIEYYSIDELDRLIGMFKSF